MGRLLPLWLLVGAGLPVAAHAQPVTGPYISLGGGAGFLQDQSLRGGAGSIRSDTGPVGSAAVGYGLGNGIRVELGGDWRENKLTGFGTALASGAQEQYGAFVNVLYDFDLRPFGLAGVTPYVGLGAGYEQFHFLNAGASTTTPFTSLRATGTAGDFAAQGILGLAFTTQDIPGLALTAEYRFSTIPEDLSTDGQMFEGGQDGRAHIRTDGAYNQTALLGLRYAIFPPAPPRPPVATLAAPAPAMPSGADRTYLVFFDWDRTDLSARGRQIVAEAVAASGHAQVTRIEVNGYTDSSGTAAYNQKLSVRRAQSVEAELVQDGVAQNDIVIRGLGETNPLVPTANGVREPQNRRVEIIVH